MAVVRHKIQKPDYRNNGKYQFVVGYTGGGAEECIHLKPEQIIERCRTKVGAGQLMDDGVDLWWEQTEPEEKVACPQCGDLVEVLTEGVCALCVEQNQQELDEYNARQDWWNNLSDKERDLIIRDAIKRSS